MPPRLDPNTESEQLHIIVPASLLERVDEWRSRQEQPIKKSEAIRVLVERALESEAVDKSERKGKAA